MEASVIIGHRSRQDSVLTIDQRHSWAILTTLADAFEITIEEFITTYLETLLNYLGSILVDAIVCRESQDVIDCAASIGWRTMLANVLDAPVSELAVRDDIDASQDFIDARTL